MTDTTTLRQAYLDARAALNKASANLDAVSIDSGPLQDRPVPELTEKQHAALVAYHAAGEAYLKASKEYHVN